MTDAAERTVALLNTTKVRVVGLLPAREVAPVLSPRHYLHAGPPITHEQLPTAMRNALLGALVFEKEAASTAEAAAILDSGGLELSPCHDAGGVGGVTGIVSPTMPVFVVKTEAGVRGFSPINEGLGPSLRYGANDAKALERLRWLRDHFAPLINRAIELAGEIDVCEIQAEGLRRGDDCHGRNAANSAAFLMRLAPGIVRLARTSEDAANVIEAAAQNPFFFGPVSFAAAKAITDTAHGVPASSIVTAIAANGRYLGVRVSGISDWITADIPIGPRRVLPGFTEADVGPMMGDSFVTELVGLGMFALAAAPATLRTLGVDMEFALQLGREMQTICGGTSSRFQIPFAGFVGTPLGLDVRAMVQTATTPLLNTPLVHSRGGPGPTAVGLTRLPLAPFARAYESLRHAAQTPHSL